MEFFEVEPAWEALLDPASPRVHLVGGEPDAEVDQPDELVAVGPPVYSRPPLLSSRRSCAPRESVRFSPTGKRVPIPRLVPPASRVPRTPRSGSVMTTRTLRCAPLRAGSQADPPAKPRGGYRIINADVIAAAWWAYRNNFIRLVDLRVWFAAHETAARRCRVRQDYPRRFNLEELRNLTGLSLKSAQALGRQTPGRKAPELVRRPIGFPDSPDQVPVGEPPTCGHSSTGSPTRRPQGPRTPTDPQAHRRRCKARAGRYPARPSDPWTLPETGKCLGRGRVKASWIAEVFGVGLRRVKQARHELIAIGWLIPLDAEQWALNRWGAHFRINLEWSRLDRDPAGNRPTRPTWWFQTEPGHSIPGETFNGAGPELAPPRTPCGPELAPPESDREPLYGGEKNQKPASGGPPGVFDL